MKTLQNAPGQKITAFIEKLSPEQPYYTFEVFPPKTVPGTANLIDRINRMSALNPSWIHVTWGAGGSSQDRSLALVEAIVKMGMDCCLHLTCTNMERTILDGALEKAKKLGVVNIVALRGDPPRGEEFWTATDDDFQHATDLVKYIRKNHGDFFCIGVAGYPEGHADSPIRSKDIDYLLEKQEAGADFVVTQLFYDADLYIEWYNLCRKRGVNVPILPGIMPIQNFQSFRRMTNLCKSKIPASIMRDLEGIKDDDAAVKDYGVDLAEKIIRKLYDHGIRGYHICTLNLEKSVSRLLQKLQWIESPKESSPVTPVLKEKLDFGTVSALKKQSRGDSPSSWDEFPNGRFGDARSPAYGEMDGYGVGLKVPASEARLQYGAPVDLSDISKIFSSYLKGSISSNPWSEEPLRPETAAISSYLIRLNDERNWWTVGSQPAIDGAKSNDPVYGFGPKGGYVYQKAFVELFLNEDELSIFEARAKDEEGIMYFAGNRRGERRSNLKKGDVNAVTWGVFPGKDIVTTTMIEEMSFKAWVEEAFDIWIEWSYLYPARSPSRDLITKMANTRWLVSVCHHDFKHTERLWEWLLE